MIAKEFTVIRSPKTLFEKLQERWNESDWIFTVYPSGAVKRESKRGKSVIISIPESIKNRERFDAIIHEEITERQNCDLIISRYENRITS